MVQARTASNGFIMWITMFHIKAQPMGSTSSGQLSNCRSTKRSWGNGTRFWGGNCLLSKIPDFQHEVYSYKKNKLTIFVEFQFLRWLVVEWWFVSVYPSKCQIDFLVKSFERTQSDSVTWFHTSNEVNSTDFPMYSMYEQQLACTKETQTSKKVCIVC